MSKTTEITRTIRCVIIDDDPFIQDLLRDKLHQYFPEIDIIGSGQSGKEGIEKIQSLNPELVFLDVEMTDMTGFEMLSQLETITFKTIFITSYKHYAIKAIRFNALDYLLKPFDLEELKNAIKRFKAGLKNNNPPDRINVALSNLKSKNVSDQILSLKTQQGELQLALKEIVHIEGERNYSFIHMANRRKELVSKTLSDLESLLDDKGFYRCHKSHLVNVCHISQAPTKFNALLSNNNLIPVSRRKKEGFLNWYHESLAK